jgi:hypothetical protein
MKRMLFLLCLWSALLSSEEKLNFATATDTEHYTWTLNLIAGIHRFHLEKMGNIAVFDLGLLPEERAHLNQLSFVRVYDIEKTHPLLLQKYTVNKDGKIARGWYAWKPVAIKQAMDLFEEFFYLDSGVSIQGPMDLLFKHLRTQGYFLIDCGQEIRRMTTKKVIEEFKLNAPANQWVLNKLGISAGIQGLTRRYQSSYINPLYQLCFNLDCFKDDGTCPRGFGYSRHDQPLFSIQARLLGLNVFEVIRGGKMALQFEGKTTYAPLSKFFKLTRNEFNLEKTKGYLQYKTIEK